MKFWIFLLPAIYAFSKCTSTKIESSIIASAISQVVNDVFRDPNNEFDFVVVKSPADNETTNEIVDKTIKLTEVSYGQKTQHYKTTSYQGRSAVFFYDSWFSYRMFSAYSKLVVPYAKQLYFLVVVNELTNNFTGHFEKIETFAIPNKTYTRIYDEYFLVMSDTKKITLRTVEKYRQPHCKSYQETEINQFMKSTLNWKSQKFAIEKYKSFDGCQMKIAKLTTNSSSLSMVHHMNASGFHVKVTGYMLELNRIIAKSLNYTSMMTLSVKNDSTSLNSHEDQMKNVHRDFRFEISSNRRNQQLQRVTTLTMTDRYTTVDEIVLVSRFKPYSMFDKMFMPFEDEVWFWLVATLVAFLLVSAVVSNFTPKFIRSFVFGLRVKHPTLNIM
jgi:hypothetical protein